MDALLAALPLPPVHLLVAWLGVGLAYVVFGMAGFGTALVAAPVLAHLVPLSMVVPLLALLDCTAATTNLLRDGHKADRAELRRIVLPMALGSVVGAALLVWGRPDALLLALGLFAVGYALYQLSGFKPVARWPVRAAWPFGMVGGVFSALFGSGGFLYAIYLSGRIDAADGIRITQSALIGLSTVTRVLLFLLAGVYADADLLQLVLLLVPAMWLGSALGRRITLRLSRPQFLRLVSVVVLGSGLALVARFLVG